MLDPICRAMLAASILSAAAPGGPSSGAGLPSTGFTVGEPFPIITFESAQGEPAETTMASFRGEKVVLHIFASW
jgi:hypothetical protein